MNPRKTFCTFIGAAARSARAYTGKGATTPGVDEQP
jgi:hypothetical protein